MVVGLVTMTVSKYFGIFRTILTMKHGSRYNNNLKMYWFEWCFTGIKSACLQSWIFVGCTFVCWSLRWTFVCKQWDDTLPGISHTQSGLSGRPRSRSRCCWGGRWTWGWGRPRPSCPPARAKWTLNNTELWLVILIILSCDWSESRKLSCDWSKL